MKASIIPLRRKLETFQKLKEDCMKTAEHIKVSTMEQTIIRRNNVDFIVNILVS